jgi:hypothetical protein
MIRNEFSKALLPTAWTWVRENKVDGIFPYPSDPEYVRVEDDGAKILFFRPESDGLDDKENFTRRVQGGMHCGMMCRLILHATIDKDFRGGQSVGFRFGGSRGFFASIGGFQSQYSIAEIVPSEKVSTFSAQAAIGSTACLTKGESVTLDVRIAGNKIVVHDGREDGKPIIEYSSEYYPDGDEVQIVAWGAPHVTVSDFELYALPRVCFVSMDFQDKYRGVFEDALLETIEDIGFKALRVDYSLAPDQLTRFIQDALRISSVVVADLSSPNPNVLYEIGFSHRADIPVIQMADRKDSDDGGNLPFMVRNCNTIFYENVIGGEKQLREDLAKHLIAVRDAQWTKPRK